MSKIIVNFDLNLTTNPSFHKDKLDFAQKVLDYYNNRLNLNITLEYTNDKFEFMYVTYNMDDFKCTSFVNYASTWYIQDRNNDKEWVKRLIDRNKSIADNIKSPLYTSMGLNILTQSDVDFFIFQKDKFKAINKNIGCYTFLSEENQILLKTALNNICDELDTLI